MRLHTLLIPVVLGVLNLATLFAQTTTRERFGHVVLEVTDDGMDASLIATHKRKIANLPPLVLTALSIVRSKACFWSTTSCRFFLRLMTTIKNLSVDSVAIYGRSVLADMAGTVFRKSLLQRRLCLK